MKISEDLTKQSSPTGQTYKLIKVAKDLEIGFSTIITFLHAKGYAIDSKPTARVTQEMYDLLCAEFKPSLSPVSGAIRIEKIPEREQPEKTYQVDEQSVQNIYHEIAFEEKDPETTAALTPPKDYSPTAYDISHLAGIGETIQRQRKHENRNRVSAPAISYIKANYLSGIENFWIVCIFRSN